MTLTKKDKILLGVLAIVIFAALMYVYGIMPANTEIMSQKTTISNKQKQVQALQDRLAAINTYQVDKQYDELLELYYSQTKVLPEQVDRVDVERFVDDLLTRHNLNYNGTQGWSLGNEAFSAVYNDETVTYNVWMLSAPIDFGAISEDASDLLAFVEYVRTQPALEITSLTLNYETNAEDGITTLKANAVLRYKMQVSVEEGTIPKPLEQCTDMAVTGDKQVSFTAVANAKSYELYTVTIGSDGKKVFTAVENAQFTTDQNTGKVTVSISGLFPTSGRYTIAVRAIGDKAEGYFKTILSDTTPTLVVHV